MRTRFLALLRETGNVRQSAAGAGIGRDALYSWRNQDPDFAAAWEDALNLGIAALEDRALELAHAGNDRLIIFLLSSKRPEIYGQRAQIEVSGQVSLNLRTASLDELRAELARHVGSLGMQRITLDAIADAAEDDPTVVMFPSQTDNPETD